MIELNDPRKLFLTWKNAIFVGLLNILMIGVCVLMIHWGSFYVIFYVLYIKHKFQKLFSFDRKNIKKNPYMIFDFETFLMILLILLKGINNF